MPRHLRWCVRWASNQKLIEKHQRRSFVFIPSRSLRRCISRRCISHKVHGTDGATGRPTGRRIVFATFESRCAAFLSVFRLPFRFPSIHDTTFLSLLSPERTRRDYLPSRRDENWPVFPPGERSENNTGQSRIRLVIKSRLRISFRNEAATCEYARDLSPREMWKEIFLVYIQVNIVAR